ncbi:MAG: hypothetical protein ACYC42_00145 [Lysobacter sp.]
MHRHTHGGGIGGRLLDGRSSKTNFSAPAGHSCETQYDVARVAISTGIDGNGDRQTLRTKLANAWRAFWNDKQRDIASGQLNTPGQLLDSNATKDVSAAALRSLFSCAARIHSATFNCSIAYTRR